MNICDVSAACRCCTSRVRRWLYNSGSDVLGVLIARATGMTLGDSSRSESSRRSA